ncbi:MAG: glycosyltransferase family 4 protein [Hyphomicrobiales bacterium]
MDEVLIDVTRVLGRLMKGRLPTGVDRVSLEYMRHFADRARAVVRFGEHSIVLPRSASCSIIGCMLNRSGNFTRTVGWQVGREILSVRRCPNLAGAFLFNTGHSGLEKATYPAQLQRLGVRPVFFVHDLIPITHPEYSRAGELNRHVVRMDVVLRLACGVIANSHATMNQLKRFAGQSGQSMPPHLVAPLAPAEFPAPAPERPLAAPYFVMLGTIEPRKNHWLILHVWRKLVERLGKRTPKLVIIGQRGWEFENVANFLERCEVLDGIVMELSSCSDADLSTYLRHAQALLFPSFVEGYGIPLVEALSLGVPVIASDLPAFREIAGDIPDYLDPLDGMGWAACIEAFADSNSPARAAQLKRQARFVPPRWLDHFELVEEFLERLNLEPSPVNWHSRAARDMRRIPVA